jgi:hypothetical protein
LRSLGVDPVRAAELAARMYAFSWPDAGAGVDVIAVAEQRLGELLDSGRWVEVLEHERRFHLDGRGDAHDHDADVQRILGAIAVAARRPAVPSGGAAALGGTSSGVVVGTRTTGRRAAGDGRRGLPRGRRRPAHPGPASGGGRFCSAAPGISPPCPSGPRISNRWPSRRSAGSELHPEQRIAMEAVVDGHDVLAVLPTGFGKSAIYQVPALLLDGPDRGGVPLLALQQDQLEGIEDSRAPEGVAVNSAQRAAERDRAWRAFRGGEAEYLFLAPEQLAKTRPWTGSRPWTSRCSWWTRRTASRPGGTTSAPTTCVWARWSSASGTRRWSRSPPPPRCRCAVTSSAGWGCATTAR